uniref:Bidirectional sugar transporter SWEET4-like n=1 Tax=Nelumbo nucifera TaxID=4432 RepID=A0A822XGJ7_NELNU|nr:TPA_asm: hypothetical protein HUJ06_019418 [Nelumbo nucifera]
MLWIVYGLPPVHPHSILVITINGAGFIIELAYVFLFLLYSDRRKRIRILAMMLVEFAFVGAIAVLVLTLAHTHDRRSLIVGSFCVFFGTLMYAAPLSIMVSTMGTEAVRVESSRNKIKAKNFELTGLPSGATSITMLGHSKILGPSNKN